jgi:hypothetical protein
MIGEAHVDDESWTAGRGWRPQTPDSGELNLNGKQINRQDSQMSLGRPRDFLTNICDVTRPYEGGKRLA